MQFILENYLIIILVGLFFVFALIGYLIDLLRKDNNKNNNINDVPSDIQTIQLNKKQELEKNVEQNVNEVQINKADELLENYDKNIGQDKER